MLSGWTKSCNIRLYNSTSTLTDYQVKFIINRSSGTNSGDNIYVGTDCQADYGDIRFTSTSDVEYSYWIESYDASSATIWVKIPSIIGTAYTDLVLQYGNSSATTTSNGNTTFDFFDDFTGSSIDSSKWTNISTGGTISVSDGRLSISGNIGAKKGLESIATFGAGTIVEAVMSGTSSSSSGGYLNFGYGWYGDNDQTCILDASDSDLTFWMYSKDTSVQSTSIGNQYTTDKSIKLERRTNTQQVATYAGYSSITHSRNISTQVKICIGTWQAGNTATYSFDCIKIRKYSAIEPTKYYPRELSDWTYRKSHTITHPTGGLTKYQTKIRVYRTTGTDSGDAVYVGDKCLADFGDIRFTNSAGTELDYWMETNAGSYADFWVEIDSISTSTNIYIYYGNATAGTTSNGDTTFVFFDDFETGTISSTKWPTGSSSYSTTTSLPYQGTYSATRSGSQAVLQSGTIETLSSHVIEMSVKFAETNKYHFPIYCNQYLLVAHSTGYWCYYTGSAYVNFITYAANTWYKVKLILNKAINTYYVYIDDALIGTVTGNTLFNAGAPSIFSLINVDSGQTAGITFDVIRIRKYTATDPIHSTWGAEQDLSATSFTIRITPTTGTDPLSVTYNCTIPEGTLTNFILNYGDGNEYTSATQSTFATSHIYDTPGTYTVWGEGYTEFATHVYYEIPYGVNVSAPSVVASFTYDQNYNTVTFTDLSTGNVNEWYWDFGDGNHSYETNPVHTYYSPATYNVTLYASNQYQYSSATSSVTITQILTPPSAYFTPARLDVINPTLPYNVTFTNLSTPTFGCTYNWTVDGGSVSTSENPSISFATHGVYDIGLTVTNALGSSTRTYNDAIRLTRKSRTMNEVIGSADTFATFGCHVFVEYPSGSDLPLVYATILPEGVYFIQREIPDVPGIDEWGVRHLYSTINEWGIRIFTALNSWGHKILHNSSSVDRTPLKCIDVEIFEETMVISDDHTFDEDPS